MKPTWIQRFEEMLKHVYPCMYCEVLMPVFITGAIQLKERYTAGSFSMNTPGSSTGM